jgi:hypothetical protein
MRVAHAEHRTLGILKQRIDRAPTSAALDAVLNFAPRAVGDHLRWTGELVTPVMHELSEGARKLSADFDRSFAREFEGLDLLAGKAFRPARTAVPAVEVAQVTADVLDVKRTLESRGKRAAANGAKVGAAMGTAFAPIVGTAIGAGIGWLSGLGAGMASVTERRYTYWGQLQPEIRAAFARQRQEYEAALDRHAANASAHLEQRIAAYEAGYAQTIQELRESHERALEELRRRRKRTQRERDEVDARTALLEQRAALLAANPRAARPRVASRSRPPS